MKNINLFCKIISALIVIVFLSSCNNFSKNYIEEIKLPSITKSEAKKIYPLGNSLNEARIKGLALISVYDKSYMEMQAAYLTVFNYYLNESVDLDKYQDDLNSSGLNFDKVSDDVHVKLASFDRNNICIRNSVYVERLDKTQIRKFKKQISNGTIKITPELVDIVKSTWKNIIIVALEPEAINLSYKINYEMSSMVEKQALNTSLTFSIIYQPTYDDDGNILSENDETRKYDYVLELKNKMENEISAKLDCDVTVFIIIK